jgi:quaternary ammonium compound-resistance protein SugE
MAWIGLLAAGLFEVGFVMGLKFSEGFTRLWPTLGMFVSGGFSFFLLSTAMRSLPAGTAYAVWTGIGTVGAVVLGILFLSEPADLMRIIAIALIVTGIVGLRLAG